MPKVNNLRVRLNLIRKCRAVKSALSKFKDAINSLKEFSMNDEMTIKFTLNSLLDEIRNATRVVREKNGK